jgi:1-phosphatidylinositol-4-phosphate 5-kinase
MGIMDYSLLLGIHLIEMGKSKTQFRRASMLNIKPLLENSNVNLNNLNNDNNANNNNELDHFEAFENVDLKKSIFNRDDGGIKSSDEFDEKTNEIYYMGIIDILQPYNLGN